MTTSMTWAEVLKWIILGILVVLQVGQAYTIVNLRRRLPGTNRRLQVGMAAPGLRTQEARSHDRALQWIVILRMLFLTPATMFLAGDAFRTLGPEKGAPVPEDTQDQLADAFDVRRVPLVYVIDRDGFMAIRTVANGRLDLEDALDGAGHLQEGEWVAMDDGDIVPVSGP